jgi:hypothetical protein
MDFEEYEAEVFEDTRPVVALAILGIGSVPKTIVNVIENTLKPIFTVIDYHPPGSPTTLRSPSMTSTSVGSSTELSAQWMSEYLWRKPGQVVVICTLSQSDHSDVHLAADIQSITEAANEACRKVYLVIYAPNDVNHEQRDNLVRMSQIPSNSVIMIKDLTVPIPPQQYTFKDEIKLVDY